MILDFSIGNYRSFNKIQTLNFRATSLISEDKTVDRNNIIEIDGNRILKTVGLYGPNGSGKSNLINGLQLFRQLVEQSLESEAIMVFAPDPFLLTDEQTDNAGFFQIQLLLDKKKYRYGFTLNAHGSVIQEWLFGPADKNETWYFKRSGENVESNKEWFEEGYNLPLDNLRRNTLFLTFASAYNGSVAQAIRGFIVKKMFFEIPGQGRRHSMFNSTGKRIFGINPVEPTNELVKEGKSGLVLDWLRKGGLDYNNIRINEQNGHFEDVILEKNIFDKEGKASSIRELDLNDNESAGTNKFYYNIGILHQLFQEGGIFISDEIDNNFHPSLLRQFVHFFNDPHINATGAQLLFTSHDTNLLHPDILRRDQIYFSEKSLTNETVLYSLSDLKGIRNNADFARQYLAGFYGALPILEKYKNE
jgi:hypothetical protein